MTRLIAAVRAAAEMGSRRRARRASAWVLAFSTLLTTAWTQEQPEPTGIADDVAVARKMLETADEIIGQVEKIRGWKFKQAVAKDVRTEAQLRDYIEGKLAEEFGDGKLERTEAWLRLLALMPADASYQDIVMEVLINQVGGFYDPDERAFFMMAEASRFGDVANRMLIAHELTHALDDQYVGLGALLEPEDRELTEDETYAVMGVTEGSATALMSVWMAQIGRTLDIDAAEMMKMQQQEMERAEPMVNAPRYFSLLAANYMVGVYFITKGTALSDMMTGMSSDSGGAIREVAADMPRSSEQILHPEKYWDPAKRDEPVRVDNDDEIAEAIAEVTGQQVRHRDTLGELICAILALPTDKKPNLMLMGQPGYWTNRAAKGWGGDRMYLTAARGDDSFELSRAGLIWITAWDTVKDREEFQRAMSRYRGEEPGFTAVASDRVVAFEFGPARGDEERLRKILGAARFTSDGKTWNPTPATAEK